MYRGMFSRTKVGYCPAHEDAKQAMVEAFRPKLYHVSSRLSSLQQMIRELSSKDAFVIYEIINAAALAYKGIIPNDCYHEPYMPKEELQEEMKSMTFFGWEEEGKLVGVMGFQPVRDVTLIRHAYVLPNYQRRGVGTRLLDYLKLMTKTKKLLVGTWADARWAINFYKKHGFKFLSDKDTLLKKYWDIPQRQVDTSVVLGIET